MQTGEQMCRTAIMVLKAQIQVLADNEDEVVKAMQTSVNHLENLIK